MQLNFKIFLFFLLISLPKYSLSKKRYSKKNNKTNKIASRKSRNLNLVVTYEKKQNTKKEKTFSKKEKYFSENKKGKKRERKLGLVEVPHDYTLGNKEMDQKSINKLSYLNLELSHDEVEKNKKKLEKKQMLLNQKKNQALINRNPPLMPQNRKLPLISQNQNFMNFNQNRNLPFFNQNRNLPMFNQNRNLPIFNQNRNLPMFNQNRNLPIFNQNQNLANLNENVNFNKERKLKKKRKIRRKKKISRRNLNSAAEEFIGDFEEGMKNTANALLRIQNKLKHLKNNQKSLEKKLSQDLNGNII